ncbi:MAG: Stk1 family PASTA domain-containing Ser/Thr kinase [Oscillospiraceae bacterium]|jgi:serine/threonine-protein kinase|nr:Stk1 family PASTA domain-containing Ser/Thr kinase [Oscillospiraceae bacterium]
MENCMDRYLGQMLDNRYEMLEVIGSGGMAVVYKALCHRLNRYVAVKVLKDEFAGNSEFREHFKAESQAVAMLSHPNIVSVYDYSRDSNCQYIVMELLEGITLKQYMQKKGALSWKEALHFATQISQALSHAHSKGIVHRDIKPQNIMVVKDGSIKVADFGIAHLQSENSKTPETMGSIHYISPEQVHGDPVDARSDIYSLGVVMYEMLTGRLPYEGDTVETIAVQHISQMLTLPGDINPDIPARLEDITLKAMASDLEARYQSADTLLAELEAFRKSQTAPTDSGGAEDGAQLPLSKKRAGIKPRRESYSGRRARTRTVSTFSGIALLAIFLIAVVTFLWSFWLRDIFVDAERVTIPDFVGKSSEAVTANDDYKGRFNFSVFYSNDPNVPAGQIISQDPEAHRSIAKKSENGIAVKLIVSTGLITVEMPDMVNHEAREAKLSLEKADFKVETAVVASDSITEGYVVSTDPAAGAQVAPGSTVTLNVSGGPALRQVTMPGLVGSSRNSAVLKLGELKLELGSISEIEDAAAEGTVIWQSIAAGESVAEHTVIYLTVSKGPKPAPSPDPSSSPDPSADPSPEQPPESEAPPEDTGEAGD